MRPVAWVCPVLFCAAVSQAAVADTLTRSILATYTDANGTVEGFGGLALFDPALGQLNSVTQTLSGQIVFTPDVPGQGSYTIGTGPLLPNETLDASALFSFSATGPGTDLEEMTDVFGQQYRIVAFDLAVQGGTVNSVGPVVDSFTFNYTPAVASTPEPSSLLLLGTGLVGTSGLLRRVVRGGR